MTQRQAMDFLDVVNNSSNPAIKNMLDPIKKYSVAAAKYGPKSFRALRILGFVGMAEEFQSPNSGACKISRTCQTLVRNEDPAEEEETQDEQKKRNE